METNRTIGGIALALSSSSVMLLSWFIVLVLCYMLFIFRVWSVVGAWGKHYEYNFTIRH
jgi:hypothetical protein